MRTLCTFVIALACMKAGLAQVSSWEQPDNWLLSEPTRNGNKAVKGQPELFNVYLEAVIQMKNGRVLKDLKLNLVERDRMLVSKPYKGVEALYEVKEDEILSFTVKETDGSERTFLRVDKAGSQTSLHRQVFMSY